MVFSRMKFINSGQRSKFLKFYSTISYEIPERYRNSFYLVNAALFDQVNWFIHRAYEICFSNLVNQLKERNPKLSDKEAITNVVGAITLLNECNSIIDVRFPIKRENGSKEIIRGFRAQHGLYSGYNTCLGGLRIKDNITRDHMKGLSVVSTYKHSCLGIRLAGAHGGIKIDPLNYSEKELKMIVQKYCAEIYSKGYCDGISDIIEPDLNTGEREMVWIASLFPEKYDKAMVVGKPVELGGIENYGKTASQGVFFALDYFINNEKILHRINMQKPGLHQKTFIIQGLGRLGSALAKYLESSGAICVGIKERDAYIYDSDGIHIESVLKHRNEFGSIQNFGKAKPLNDDEIFKEQCDILILAAQQKSLICYIADKVKAKIIVEAANGSITPTSHRILVGRCKLVLPDIYVCSGYSVASYLEHLLHLKEDKNKQIYLIRQIYKNILESFTESTKSYQIVPSATIQKMVSCEMKPDVLTYAIDHVMSETGNELLDIAKEYNLDLDIRTAAYIKAIQSIHNSIYELKRY